MKPKATVPQFGKTARINVPQLKRTRRKAQAPLAPAPKTDLRILTDAKSMTAQEIGQGPWTLQGYKASRPEYMVGRALDKLGWRYKFQSSFMGGRTLPGGQVLDFVIDERKTVVDVRGYYHLGAEKNYNDFIKAALCQQAGYSHVIVWEHDVDQSGWLLNFLMGEVGTRGGR